MVVSKTKESQESAGNNSVEPPRIIIKIPESNYKESIVIKSRGLQGLDSYVEFCENYGAPDSYKAFENLLLEEYLFRQLQTLGKKNLKEMIALIIDKMASDE